jgi:hypothetical protein
VTMAEMSAELTGATFVGAPSSPAVAVVRGAAGGAVGLIEYWSNIANGEPIIVGPTLPELR